MECNHNANPPICVGHTFIFRASRRQLRDNFIHDNFPELEHDEHHVLHAFITWLDTQSGARKNAIHRLIKRGSYLDDVVSKWKSPSRVETKP